MRVGRRTCHEEGMVRGCVPGAGMSHGLAFVTNSRHLSEGKTWASATHQPEPLPPQKSEWKPAGGVNAMKRIHQMRSERSHGRALEVRRAVLQNGEISDVYFYRLTGTLQTCGIFSFWWGAGIVSDYNILQHPAGHSEGAGTRAVEWMNKGRRRGDIPFPFSDQEIGQCSLRFSLRNCFPTRVSMTENILK